MVSEDTDRTAQAGRGARETLVDLLQLFGLGAFAVAQPLFEVLEADATFFVARRSEPADIVLLVLLLIGVAPLVLGTLELVAGRVSPAARRAVHRFAVGLLVALAALPPMARAIDVGGAWIVLLAVLVGAVAARGAGWGPLRSFFTLLGLAPPVFAALFLASPSIAKLTFPPSVELGPPVTHDAGGVPPSVVLLVLDELPLASLLDAGRAIDAVRFPSFARLAREGTWYRNASTSHTHTNYSVPSMLTGREPSDPELLPVLADHPENLFTLLAGSHRMHVQERVTRLLPAQLDRSAGARAPLSARMGPLLVDAALVWGHVVLPDDLARGLPPVTERWGDFLDPAALEPPAVFDRMEPGDTATDSFERARDPMRAFQAFLAGIEDGGEPTLHFLHVMLPHSPWIHLPSGRRATVEGQLPSLVTGIEPRSEAGRLLAWQQHLLQVGCVDLLLGELLERMESVGILDSAVLVVVADHGISFQAGVDPRVASERNLDDLMRIPFFVRLPGRHAGRTSDESVEGIDVLPTIADALDVQPGWPMDGRSVLEPTAGARPVKRVHSEDGSTWELDAAPPASWPTLARRIELFGASSPWERVFGIGPRHGLLGSTTSGATAASASGTTLRMDRTWRYDAFDPEAPEVPSLVLGRLLNADPDRLPREIALGVGGTIRAVAPILERDSEGARLAVMLPESAFQPGRNRVEVFAVLDGGRLARLPERSWTLVATSRGERISASDGVSLAIEDGALQGAVTQAREIPGALELVGWAANLDAGIVADEILVFVDGLPRPFTAGTGLRRRSLLERTGSEKLAHAGFRLELPLSLLGESPIGKLRVIARSGSRAEELPLRRSAAWLRAP